MSADIVIVGVDEITHEKLKTALNNAELSIIAVEFKDISTALQNNLNCNTLIFNLESNGTKNDFAVCCKIADTINSNPKTSHMRIICIGVPDNLIDLSGSGKFDDLLFGPPRIPAIVAKVVSLQRLKTMHGELQRRISTAEKYGFEAPEPASPTEKSEKNASILLTGRPNGFGRIEATLSQNAVVNVALSLRAASDYLCREEFDMLIINGGINPTRYLSFITEIRENPDLYNLPILLIANPSKLSDSHIAYAAGVTDIIDAPINQKELTIRVDALIEEKRFRGSMGNAYQQARHFPTNDALTGLYAHGFFHEHLTELIDYANSFDRQFSLINIAIENMTEINQEFGYASGDSILRHVAEILMTVIRGEDLASRYSGDVFIITLPDTNAKHATNVVKRIEGIVQQTKFICTTEGQPISVDLSAEVIESKGEKDTKSILMRSHQIDKQRKAIFAA